MGRGKAATLKQKQALARKHERRYQNNKLLSEAARPRRNMSHLHTFGLPPMDSAPAGARVLEARGPFAVALAINGIFIGLFARR